MFFFTEYCTHINIFKVQYLIVLSEIYIITIMNFYCFDAWIVSGYGHNKIVKYVNKIECTFIDTVTMLRAIPNVTYLVW